MSRYATPEALKAALEARLRRRAQQTGREVNRLRMRLIMDRYAARLAAELGPAVVLKGGVALELRLEAARATKDLDIHLMGTSRDTLGRLQAAGRRDLGEYLQFEVQPDPRHPTIDAEGMQYEGLRFRVQARLAGKVYGAPFGVDAAFAEPLAGQPDVIEGSDLLSFAGIPPTPLRVYPIETHIAEKLHAYTLPRTRPNSRVKDLPDLALLASIRPLLGSTVRDAITRTFAHRDTHEVPKQLPEPPAEWEQVYARLARRDHLLWPDLSTLSTAVRAFLGPLLAGASGTWSPDSWDWEDE